VRTKLLIAARAAAVLCVLAGAGVVGCSTTVCDCSDIVGLSIWTSAPVTDVKLSGPACAGGRFRCEPADFDDTIHDPCTKLQVEAEAEGSCVVDLTVGGSPVHLERQMSRRPPGCCGGYIGEAKHQGFIDLRAHDDAGADERE
jgi:hypothetical protein